MKRFIAVMLALAILAGCDDGEALERTESARQDAQKQAEAWQREAREAQRRAEETERQRAAEVMAAQRRAEEAERQRAAETRSIEQRRQISEQKTADAEADRSGAITMWVTTSMALALVIFLLARERYLRRTFVKMARMIFARGPEDG